jgi:hypothetical protein
LSGFPRSSNGLAIAPVDNDAGRHCWEALTAASYLQCMYGKDQGYATAWFSQVQYGKESSIADNAALWEAWRSVLPAPGSYKTHVKLEECKTATDLKDYKDFITYLLVAKSPTQDYSVLAELHRDLHSLLAGAGQISTEYNKTK